MPLVFVDDKSEPQTNRAMEFRAHWFRRSVLPSLRLGGERAYIVQTYVGLDGPSIDRLGEVSSTFLESGSLERYASEVERSLLIAEEHRNSRDPALVVVGNRGGGVVAFDVLSRRQRTTNVDLFITVDAPIAPFLESSELHDSREPIPPNIGRWFNVFSRARPLGLPLSAIFSNVVDIVIEQPVSRLGGTVFELPEFYEKLANPEKNLKAQKPNDLTHSVEVFFATDRIVKSGRPIRGFPQLRITSKRGQLQLSVHEKLT